MTDPKKRPAAPETPTWVHLMLVSAMGLVVIGQVLVLVDNSGGSTFNRIVLGVAILLLVIYAANYWQARKRRADR